MYMIAIICCYRVCVQADLPHPLLMQLDIVLLKANNGTLPTSHLHVQSISHWAPANIGTYSQAFKVSSLYHHIQLYHAYNIIGRRHCISCWPNRTNPRLHGIGFTWSGSHGSTGSCDQCFESSRLRSESCDAGCVLLHITRDSWSCSQGLAEGLSLYYHYH